MKLAWRFSTSIGLALALCQSHAVAETVDLSPCTIPELAEPARCGEIEVPENPDRPGGRQLKIAIAVVPATSGRALADPIVPLMGGPGEDAISAGAHFARMFATLRVERDLLLVDQRGTGKSSALRCKLYDPEAPATSLREFFPVPAVEACARELSPKADLTQYTYAHFARDLEQVRKDLGYQKLNLFSGSYGTRAAQVFVRAFPDSVRTVYFWSMVPIDVVTPMTMAQASQAAFESTFDACAADSACHAAFPNIAREFDQVVAALESGSVRVSVAGVAEKAPLSRGRVDRMAAVAALPSADRRGGAVAHPPRAFRRLVSHRRRHPGAGKEYRCRLRPRTVLLDYLRRRHGIRARRRYRKHFQGHGAGGLPRAPAKERVQPLAKGHFTVRISRFRALSGACDVLDRRPRRRVSALVPGTERSRFLESRRICRARPGPYGVERLPRTAL